MIQGILDNYLIIDADVFFLKPMIFMDKENPIFSVGDEFHEPYFEHMSLLHSSFDRIYNKSGICHHMLFNKKYINEIFNIVEEYHNKPFWEVFILSIKEHLKYNNMFYESGASEYELYFNYVVKNHREDIIIRNLNWTNTKASLFNPNEMMNYYDYVSVCNWMN